MMKFINDDIAATLMPGEAEIRLWHAFLDITETDVALLEDIHERLAQQQDSFVAAFCQHLQKFPALSALLQDDTMLARLKQTQASYFNGLTGGEYGADYVRHRLRVGIVHQHIGLEPQWYIGAYRKYLSELMPVLAHMFAGDQEKFIATYNALLKVVCFDMSLALDTYIQLRQQEILGLQNFSEQIISSMPVGVMIIDQEYKVRSMNRAIKQMFNLNEQMAIPNAPLALLIRNPILQESVTLGWAKKPFRTDFVITETSAQGNACYLRCNLSSAPLDHQDLLLLTVEDITAPMQTRAELLHLARHDPLTGLANRALLLDRLAQALAYAHRAGRFVAVLFIDLDRFKNINDSLGHEAGDSVIVEVGRRLQNSIRDGDTVARMGGDEFVVVLSDIAREDQVASLARNILEALEVPMFMEGHELSPVGSIGVSLYPKDGRDQQTLLKNADAAMYRAKQAGRSNFQFYAQEMNARTLDRLRLESRLRHALVRDEFLLVYQPQVDLASGQIVAVEALLRWQPPDEDMVLPGDFIPIAEETGLIVPIGEWVLRAACKQLVQWHQAGWPDLRVAINLSARQFKQAALEQMVARILHETGCGAQHLELEITESVVMDDPKAAIDTLQHLSRMGIQLAIDDFGTGYSSLNYLKRFPIHTLKIDRSFVGDILVDADDAAIVRAIIVLAHSMKLTVIAEGVETAEQMHFLHEQHCDQMQGYYFAKPLPAQQLQALLRR